MDIDNTAQTDPKQFWKLVRKRKNSQNQLCAGIEFNGEKLRDPKLITEGWANFFETLYTPQDNDFDNVWKQHVSSNVLDVLNELSPDDRAIVLPEHVEQSIKSLPKGKAGGFDGLKYEHLIYARRSLSHVLANICTYMLRTAFVPDALKRGVIITLHKGGNKRSDNPDNYRAITLSSVLFKVFEDIVLQRSKTEILQKINRGGFQDELGCIMTSFVLRETVQFARENGSKLYVAYMDGKKAFDVVWHEGLLCKIIHECHLDHTTILAYFV